MIPVQVALPSGRSTVVSIEKSSSVKELKNLTQKSFRQGFLQLVTAEGRHLTDLTEPFEAAGIKEEDDLTAIALQPQLQATSSAFALWCAGGDRIVTWGTQKHGGDSSAVQHQLRGVQQVRGTWGAFAALLTDGSVITWGDATYGGDSSEVQHQLRNVQQLEASRSAFAAILADRSVVMWGAGCTGGDSSAVQDQLKRVQQIQATVSSDAFAAILADGSVVTWGAPTYGGDSSKVQHQLRNVQHIKA